MTNHRGTRGNTDRGTRDRTNAPTTIAAAMPSATNVGRTVTATDSAPSTSSFVPAHIRCTTESTGT